jgi:hypothetical protein
MSHFSPLLTEFSLALNQQIQVQSLIHSVWKNKSDILRTCHWAWIFHAFFSTSLLKKNSSPPIHFQ